MSIERCKAVFGVGFEVEADENVLNDLFDKSKYYKYEHSGDCYYSGEEWRYFVFLRKELKEIAENIEKEELRLGHFLNDNDIKIIGDFGLHGAVRMDLDRW